MKRLAACSLAAMIAAMIAGTPYAAAGKAGFEVSPHDIHFELAGGAHGDQTVVITNTGDRTLTLGCQLGDSRYLPDGAEVNMPACVHPRSCAEWIELGERIVELAAGETKEIPVALDAPEGIKGTYWSKLFVEATTGPAPTDVSHTDRTYRIFQKERVEVRIMLDVAGTADRLAEIDRMGVELPGNDEPPVVSVRVGNAGNTLLQCLAHVELRDRDGGAVETLRVAEAGGFPLEPGACRDFVFRGEAALEPGRYRAIALVDFGGEFVVAGNDRFTVGGGTQRADADASAAPPAAVDLASAVAHTPAPAETRRGYTVQIRAASSEGEAGRFIAKHQPVLDAELYTVHENVYHAVRGGHYTELSEANELLARVRELGIGGAWVVPVEIEVPAGSSLELVGADETLPDAAEEPEALGAPPAPPQPEWLLEVFTTTDWILAGRYAREMRRNSGAESRVLWEAPYYKVCLGGFSGRDDAGHFRDQLIAQGYHKVEPIEVPAALAGEGP